MILALARCIRAHRSRLRILRNPYSDPGNCTRRPVRRVYRDMRVTTMAIVAALVASWALAQEHPAYTFGTTVVDLSALDGRVYFLAPKTQRLPNFDHLKPVGSVYTIS